MASFNLEISQFAFTFDVVRVVTQNNWLCHLRDAVHQNQLNFHSLIQTITLWPIMRQVF